MTADDPIVPIRALPRDHLKRPLVTPPGGGKPVAYTRCTTYVDSLEDKWNLHRWDERMVALGLSERPDLLLQLNSLGPRPKAPRGASKEQRAADRKWKSDVNAVCDKAKEHAKAHAAATIGTALHALTERLDRGLDVGFVPDEYHEALASYVEKTAHLEAVWIEQFSVCDDLKVGGTPDRVVVDGGVLKIADLKTGEQLDLGLGKIAMQLAIYAHSKPAPHWTSEAVTADRLEWGPNLDLETAIVIHMPSDGGPVELLDVDIAKGWEDVALATGVRRHRAFKGWARPYQPTELLAMKEEVAAEVAAAKFSPSGPQAIANPVPLDDAPQAAESKAMDSPHTDLPVLPDDVKAALWAASNEDVDVYEWLVRSRGHLDEARKAHPNVSLPFGNPSVEAQICGTMEVRDLEDLWEAHQATWTPELSALAAARKALIEHGVA